MVEKLRKSVNRCGLFCIALAFLIALGIPLEGMAADPGSISASQR